MRYLALASDYDGTLAHHGRVDEPTLGALKRLQASGRKLLLVTGRELEDLQSVFPQLSLFDWVVAENGALLYKPSSREEKPLGSRPPDSFIQALRERGVQPISVGRVIVATWEPHEKTVLDVIHAHGLELQVIFNKGAVMVLPTGITKASGLSAALRELDLSPHNVVGVGDAENDHALLRLCECSAAVANALPALKESADLVTAGAHSIGVCELIDQLVANDLHAQQGRLTRHHLLLGSRADGQEERIPPYGTNVLIAGPSGSGKSTTATAFLERLVEQEYQFCIIDPEGDYETFAGAIIVGNGQQRPNVDEVFRILKTPAENVVVNLVGLPINDRPAFFLKLLPGLLEMRARTGRPHWLVVDEAHHLLPLSWEPAPLAQEFDPMLLITVHPDQVTPAIVARVDRVIAVGPTPQKTLGEFCRALGERPPPLPVEALSASEVVVWSRRSGESPYPVRVAPGHTERRRHSRKYSEGELPPERSFYFRGPDGKLNLRAQNLILFLQMADGVDDQTWLHHLRQGDYSRWFRERIKDDTLADLAARIEQQTNLTVDESRKRIREVIEQYYTLPAAATASG